MVAPPRFVVAIAVILPLLALAASVHGDDLLAVACGSTGNFTANGTYAASLNALLTSVDDADYGFYNLSAGRSPDTANAIALCRGGIGPADCRSCLNDSAAEIARQCPMQKEAVLWHDYCMLRYSNQSIFGVVDGSPTYYLSNVYNVTGNVDQFNQVLRNLMDGLRDRAANGNSTRKFAVGNATAPNFQTLFGLAQCTPD